MTLLNDYDLLRRLWPRELPETRPATLELHQHKVARRRKLEMATQGGLCLVVCGELWDWQVSPHTGRLSVVAHWVTGDIIPYTAHHLRAHVNTHVLELGSGWERVIPGAAWVVLHKAQTSLADMGARLASVNVDTASERIAGFVARRPDVIRATDVAHWVGCSREMTSRVLADMGRGAARMRQATATPPQQNG